jgi:hypothetical protein
MQEEKEDKVVRLKKSHIGNMTHTHEYTPREKNQRTKTILQKIVLKKNIENTHRFKRNTPESTGQTTS